tara:strand:+ start:264 stop:551 length:288 start_codon:yes stop_codon:yes gene_type:complete
LSKNKSDILKQLSVNFPNFLNKDLSKVIKIILDNIKNSLKNNERVELRDTIIFEAKSFKERYARDPRNNQKVFVPERKLIKFKISKKWQKVINEK